MVLNDHAYLTSLLLGQFPKHSPLTTENVKKNDFRTLKDELAANNINNYMIFEASLSTAVSLDMWL